MFEDWSTCLSTIDVDGATERQVRVWLAAASVHQGALEGFVARCAGRLGDASAVRGATRCTQREADAAVARGEIIDAMPEVGEAMAAGEISGAHVDVLGKTAKRTSVDAVASGGLLDVARAKPADAMRAQVNEFVRDHANDADLAERARRQQRDRRAVLVHDDMGVLHAEFDDTTYAHVKAAIDAETDRLFHTDGGRDAAGEVRTPQQRRADALASLILGGGRGCCDAPVRNQMTIVAQLDGSGVVPGVGPLPRAEIERLACISDLYGIVFDGDGRTLWHGNRVRLATEDQWRALIARDGGCIGCDADPSRCEAHHVKWVRNGGKTDIENLVLVCKHHHHLIHDNGWLVRRDGEGRWTLAPP